jgi:hypothetical protein
MRQVARWPDRRLQNANKVSSPSFRAGGNDTTRARARKIQRHTISLAQIEKLRDAGAVMLSLDAVFGLVLHS